MSTARERDAAPYPCPACGQPLYGWATARRRPAGEELVVDRCERCGLLVTRAGAPPDPSELPEPGANGIVELPNAGSLAAWIGAASWAWLRPGGRRLHPTPRAAELLYRQRGVELGLAGTPLGLGSYLAMLQTMINAFTLGDNVVGDWRWGRLRAGGLRQRSALALDLVVSALVAIPLSAVAAVAEGLGAALGRGGRMVLRRARSS